METEVLLKDHPSSTNNLKVVQKGNVIETLNIASHLIHRIDLSYVHEKIYVHSWLGYRSDEEFKEIVSNHFMNYFKKNNCTKVLIDISLMTGSFAKLNDWMANDIMPELISSGLKCTAVVLPKNIFAQLSAAQWEEKTSGFVNHNFESFNLALNWLRKQ